MIARISVQLLCLLLASLVQIAVAQVVLEAEVRTLGEVENVASREAPILTSTIAFDSGFGDPILVRIEMEPDRQVAKSLVVQFRDAKVAAPPAIFRCIESPDPRSVTVILGYVDKDLPGVKSLANVEVSVDSRPRLGSTDGSEPPYVGFRIQSGEIVAAWVRDGSGNETELDLAGASCEMNNARAP